MPLYQSHKEKWAEITSSATLFLEEMGKHFAQRVYLTKHVNRSLSALFRGVNIPEILLLPGARSLSVCIRDGGRTGLASYREHRTDVTTSNRGAVGDIGVRRAIWCTWTADGAPRGGVYGRPKVGYIL